MTPYDRILNGRTIEEILPGSLLASLDGDLTEAEILVFKGASKYEDIVVSSLKPIDLMSLMPTPDMGYVVRSRLLSWFLRTGRNLGFMGDLGVRIRGAYIDGHLGLEDSTISFPLYLDECFVPGGICLMDAHIRELSLEGSVVGHEGLCIEALQADGLVNECNLTLKNSTFIGQVRLVGATIGSQLNAQKAIFGSNHWLSLDAELSQTALLVDSLHTVGDCNFSEIETTGCVGFAGANFEGDLDLDYAIIRPHPPLGSGSQVTLHASRLNVRGDLYLRLKFCEGEVRIRGANIGSCLYLGKGEFLSDERASVDLVGTVVSSALNFIRPMDCSPVLATVQLAGVKTAVLLDTPNFWPTNGHYALGGFIYGRFGNESEVSKNYRERLKWIRGQKLKEALPQPYEVLAEALYNAGDEAGAREVQIAKNDDRLLATRMTPAQWVLRRIWKYAVAYGYKPWRALYWFLAVWILGSIVFGIAWVEGLLIMTPAAIGKLSDEAFCAVAYSLDLLVPFLDLQQDRYWAPLFWLGHRAASWSLTWSMVVAVYFWIHILAGWLLISVLAGALSGIIRKR